jgi:hypothetical protein
MWMANSSRDEQEIGPPDLGANFGGRFVLLALAAHGVMDQRFRG